jgi:hypothetical protein
VERAAGARRALREGCPGAPWRRLVASFVCLFRCRRSKPMTSRRVTRRGAPRRCRGGFCKRGRGRSTPRADFAASRKLNRSAASLKMARREPQVRVGVMGEFPPWVQAARANRRAAADKIPCFSANPSPIAAPRSRRVGNAMRLFGKTSHCW